MRIRAADRVGDTVGSRWDNGIVTTPPGFKAAYRSFVEGADEPGGADEHGGQGLPFALAAALMADLNAANLGSALPMLGWARSSGRAPRVRRAEARLLAKMVSGEWRRR